MISKLGLEVGFWAIIITHKKIKKLKKLKLKLKKKKKKKEKKVLALFIYCPHHPTIPAVRFSPSSSQPHKHTYHTLSLHI
jgi:hypothetical protein